MTIVWQPARADSNPWSDSDWSPEGQAWYQERHGIARARDAGSYLGAPGPNKLIHGVPIEPPKAGPPPPGERQRFAPAVVVRPGSPAIYKIEE